MTSDERVRDCIETYERCINSGDAKGIDAVVAPGYRLHDPDLPDVVGREGVRERIEELGRAFSDLRMTTDDLIIRDGRAAARWTMTGTHDGPFMGLEPTGRSVRVTGVTFISVGDQGMEEVWQSWDSAGLRNQLGVERVPERDAAG